MLATIVLLFILAGLALYTVLGGADFGAGLWQLSAGRGPRARAIRDHAHHSIAPVWEANHVWLIFALTVAWTAFPAVVGAVASTLTIPLSIAGLGIIARGIAYALQSATEVPHERRVIDTVFGLASILTPYMLGSTLGAIASGRVPVGNAAGNLVTSWVNPTSILCGALAVAVGAFLAAVYLAADARRLSAGELERAFRARSLAAGVVAGVLAVAGLIVVHHDAERIYHGLTGGWGLAAVIVSALAGLTTLALVWGNRFQLARAGAALAVAAILVGWAAAQRPIVLPGLTLRQAAAPNDTLIALIISVVVGGLILAPSLGLLFRLVLAGSLDPAHEANVSVTPPSARHTPRSGRLAQLAIGCLLVGLVLLTLADPNAAHIVGVTALLTAGVLGFAAAAPDETTLDDTPSR